MLGCLENGKLTIEEIHRFSNDPVMQGGTFYWDILRLLYEIKQGIIKAVNAGGFDSIGIDTWGVDFGLLDKKGRLLENPVHYRDSRTVGKLDEMFNVVPREDIYNVTGIQFMELNTLTQLFSLSKQNPELLDRADTLLLTPDLLSYFLTGEKHSEYTISSTTQMLDAHKGDWSYELLNKLSIPADSLQGIIHPGTVYGMLSDEICEELSAPKVPVVAVASHDTASAVIAVPAKEPDFAYISCGTWSLFGIESDKPIINELSSRYNMTNEGGFGRTIRFLKNIMGLWLIQESRRQWQREGEDVSFAQLEREALAVEPFKAFIDPDAQDFFPPGNHPRRVAAFCERTGQYVPRTRGEIMRSIYESLSLKYRYTLECIEEITGKRYNAIHVVGGGTKDNFLCQLTANATGLDVIAGPIEATVLGNVAVQFISSGDIKDLNEARSIIASSCGPITYTPDRSLDWDAAYERFKAYIQ